MSLLDTVNGVSQTNDISTQPFVNTLQTTGTSSNVEDIDIFGKFYDFSDLEIIVIRHESGSSIRVIPNNDLQVDCKGDIDAYSQWLVRPQNDGKQAMLQNVKTMKYLRIHEGCKVDCDGDGTSECLFNIHIQSFGIYKFESVEYMKKYIKVDSFGLHVGDIDEWCRFICCTRGPNTTYELYNFNKPCCVLLQYNSNNHNGGLLYFTLKGGDQEELTFTGDINDNWALWYAEPTEDKQHIKLKNYKTGRYLRIHEKKLLRDEILCDTDSNDPECILQVLPVEAPYHVQLISIKYNNKCIDIDGGKIRVGKRENACCTFTIYEKKKLIPYKLFFICLFVLYVKCLYFYSSCGLILLFFVFFFLFLFWMFK